MLDHGDTPVTANYHLDPRDDEYPNPCDLCRVRQVRAVWCDDFAATEALLCFVCHTCFSRLMAAPAGFGHG
jgi:hypothetical protein